MKSYLRLSVSLCLCLFFSGCADPLTDMIMDRVSRPIEQYLGEDYANVRVVNENGFQVRGAPNSTAMNVPQSGIINSWIMGGGLEWYRIQEMPNPDNIMIARNKNVFEFKVQADQAFAISFMSQDLDHYHRQTTCVAEGYFIPERHKNYQIVGSGNSDKCAMLIEEITPDTKTPVMVYPVKKMPRDTSSSIKLLRASPVLYLIGTAFGV